MITDLTYERFLDLIKLLKNVFCKILLSVDFSFYFILDEYLQITIKRAKKRRKIKNIPPKRIYVARFIIMLPLLIPEFCKPLDTLIFTTPVI